MMANASLPSLRIPLSGHSRRLVFGGLIAVVAIVICWQILHRGFGVGLPSQQPAGVFSTPATVVAPAVYAAASRNPFDASLSPWSADLPAIVKTDASPKEPASTAAGIMRLPGLDVAVTDKGLIRVGQPMLGGRFKGIVGDNYIIETEAGEEQRVPIARPPRPTLESLNRAKKAPQETQ
jgi:hypothetical protein